MSNGTKRSIAGAIVGVLALVAVLVGVTFLLNGSSGFSTCVGTVGCGWIVPLLAGLVIAGILWVLSSQPPKYDQDEETDDAVCRDCGAPVLGGWRLCPTCGSRLRE